MEGSVPCSIASRSERAEFKAHGCVIEKYVIAKYCVSSLLSVVAASVLKVLWLIVTLVSLSTNEHRSQTTSTGILQHLVGRGIKSCALEHGIQRRSTFGVI